MKKMLFFLAASIVLFAVLAPATSCNKIENVRELTELFVLIAEGELLVESEYTSDSWIPFSDALYNAKKVAGRATPVLSELNDAIDELRRTMRELVEV